MSAAPILGLAVISLATVPFGDANRLTPGESIAGELQADERHVYRAEMRAGQFWRVEVEQDGVDIAFEVLTPDGARLAAVDSPFNRRGTERAFLDPPADGTYKVVLWAREAAPPVGRDRIRLSEAPPPIDRRRVAAEVAATRAAGLYLDSLRSRVGLRSGNIVTHWRVGGAMERSGEKRRHFMPWR